MSRFFSIGMLLLCIFDFRSALAGGPTPPGSNSLFGLYFNSFTLSAAGPGPDYYVLGDVFLEPGCTMTVEPGVTVHFVANHDTLQSGDFPTKSELIVDGGSLVVNGGVADSVYFTSTSSTPQEGDWGQIKFALNGTGYCQYASLHYATNGFYNASSESVSVLRTRIADVAQLGVRASGTKGLFQQVTIERTGSHGIYDDGTDALRWNKIRNTTGDGIRVGGTALPRPEILGNDLTDCGGDGIYVLSSVNTISLKNNLIVRAGNGVRMDYDACCGSGTPLIVDYCTITNCRANGVILNYIGGGYFLYTYMIITNSIIALNGNFGVSDSFSGSDDLIHHNDLWGNASGGYSGTTCDDHCYSINPLFENPSADDYQLIMQSSLRVAGVNGTQIGRYGPSPGGSTGLPREEQFPGLISLQQNFPNPFSGRTNFLVVAARNLEGRMELVGVDGKLLKSWTVSLREGENVLPFSNPDLSPGVYFYRLSGPGFVQSRKLVIRD
jgi:hypothetical protein